MARKRTGPAKHLVCGKIVVPNDKVTATPETWVVLGWTLGEWYCDQVCWDYNEAQSRVRVLSQDGEPYIVHHIPAVNP